VNDELQEVDELEEVDVFDDVDALDEVDTPGDALEDDVYLAPGPPLDGYEDISD
jgi:hypothetical protein